MKKLKGLGLGVGLFAALSILGGCTNEAAVAEELTAADSATVEDVIVEEEETAEPEPEPVVVEPVATPEVVTSNVAPLTQEEAEQLVINTYGGNPIEFTDRGSMEMDLSGPEWEAWEANLLSNIRSHALAVPDGFLLSQFNANSEAWTFDATSDAGRTLRVIVGKNNGWALAYIPDSGFHPEYSQFIGRIKNDDVTEVEARQLASSQVSGEILRAMPGSATNGPVWLIFVANADGSQTLVTVYKEMGLLTVSN